MIHPGTAELLQMHANPEVLDIDLFQHMKIWAIRNSVLKQDQSSPAS